MRVCCARPPLLPCIGMAIPRTWILAMSFLRALRDGRDPVLVATQVRHAYLPSSHISILMRIS